MHWIPTSLLIVGSILGGCASDSSRSHPLTVLPVASSETRTQAAGWGHRSWDEQHQDGARFMQANEVDLLLLGDSITQSFGGGGRQTGQPGAAALAHALPKMLVSNQGISGDRTQHVLWRLDNGALAQRCPRFVSLMIGTNNLPHDSANDIALGIEAIVDWLSSRCPASSILLHAIPPRGAKATDPMRKKVQHINTRIRALALADNVHWIDPWSACLLEDGTINPKVMAGDAVHLNSGGYRLWAETLKASIETAH